MDKLMKYIKSKAKSDSFVGLFSAKEVDKQYQRFNFVKRPSELCDPGMLIPFDTLRDMIVKNNEVQESPS
jgi:hypothetical protein